MPSGPRHGQGMLEGSHHSRLLAPHRHRCARASTLQHRRQMSIMDIDTSGRCRRLPRVCGHMRTHSTATFGSGTTASSLKKLTPRMRWFPSAKATVGRWEVIATMRPCAAVEFDTRR